MFNLKELNKVVPYAHFKMEVLFLLKEMPLPEDFMCKTDLNNVYFAVSPSKKSQKYARSQWKSQLWKDQEFWSKLMKVSISLRRKLSIRTIIYLDDMLLMAAFWKEPSQHFNVGSTLFQHCGSTLHNDDTTLPWRCFNVASTLVKTISKPMGLSKSKELKIDN